MMTPEKFLADYIGSVDEAFDIFRKDVKGIVDKIKDAMTVFYFGSGGIGFNFDLILFAETVLGAFLNPVRDLVTNLALAPAKAILGALAKASEEELGIGQSSQFVMTVRAAKAQAIRELCIGALVVIRDVNFPRTSNIATVYAVSERVGGIGALFRMGFEKYIGKKISTAIKVAVSLVVNGLFKIGFSISAVALVYAFWSAKKAWPALTHANKRVYEVKKGRFHVAK